MAAPTQEPGRRMSRWGRKREPSRKRLRWRPTPLTSSPWRPPTPPASRGPHLPAPLPPRTAAPAISFFGNGANWTINQSGLSSANITGNVFHGTDGNGGEGVTAWYDNLVYINGFVATFTYQDVGGSAGANADGTSFDLQESGPTYLGAGGGALGISGLTPSADWEINLYSPNGIGIVYHTDGDDLWLSNHRRRQCLQRRPHQLHNRVRARGSGAGNSRRYRHASTASPPTTTLAILPRCSEAALPTSGLAPPMAVSLPCRPSATLPTRADPIPLRRLW